MKGEIFDESVLISQLSDPKQQRRAFGVMVKRFSPQIYWQIRRLVFSHDDANDVMQNAFLKAWLNLDSFRGESKISTWIFRIATNEALNFLQRKRENVSLDAPEASSVSQITADEYFDGDEAQLQFQKVIATLPDKPRLVFNMKYFDNMKY